MVGTVVSQKPHGHLKGQVLFSFNYLSPCRNMGPDRFCSEGNQKLLL